MKSVTTYLNFDGNAREAMTFYHQCLGGDFMVQSFAEAGTPGPPGAEDRVVHARIARGAVVIMASDTMPGMPFQAGNNVHLCVECDSPSEQDQLFSSLGEGGKVAMPLQDTFWGARFGMLTDRYGIGWMLNYTKRAPGTGNG